MPRSGGACAAINLRGAAVTQARVYHGCMLNRTQKPCIDRADAMNDVPTAGLPCIQFQKADGLCIDLADAPWHLPDRRRKVSLVEQGFPAFDSEFRTPNLLDPLRLQISIRPSQALHGILAVAVVLLYQQIPRAASLRLFEDAVEVDVPLAQRLHALPEAAVLQMYGGYAPGQLLEPLRRIAAAHLHPVGVQGNAKAFLGELPATINE